MADLSWCVCGKQTASFHCSKACEEADKKGYLASPNSSPYATSSPYANYSATTIPKNFSPVSPFLGNVPVFSVPTLLLPPAFIPPSIIHASIDEDTTSKCHEALAFRCRRKS